MPLERIFLYLAIGVFLVYLAAVTTTMISLWPFGIIGLLVVAFVIYVAWRLVNDHNDNDEDRYYEDNFDK